MKSSEKLKEYKRNWNRKWRLEHPQESRMLQRKYRLARITRLGGKKEYNEDAKERIRKWRKDNPEKVIAHRKVFVAVRNGSLKKQPCFCGDTKVEAHHDDYSKPLEITWLCQKHHGSADSIRRFISSKIPLG
jgi:hypothetical protein